MRRTAKAFLVAKNYLSQQRADELDGRDNMEDRQTIAEAVEAHWLARTIQKQS
jgi:hypothetical protein